MVDSIIIRLLRSEDQEKDDKIILRRRHPAQGGFLLRYTDGLLPNKVWVQDKTFDETMAYLDRTFLYLKYDNDPFKSIQIDIPSHPLILIKMTDFSDELMDSTLHTIYDCLSKPPSYFYA